MVDRDLQLPVCRNAVAKSWGNDIGNKLQKIKQKIYTCFGVNYRTQIMLCCCYMNLNKIKLSFEDITFLGGDFFQNWKKKN
jgi:hypothetical protein